MRQVTHTPRQVRGTIHRVMSGFAMPSILIASIVMLLVLLAAVSSVIVARNALNEQEYALQAREAAESGQKMAITCLTRNHYAITWSADAPLTPATDCTGAVVTGQSPYVAEAGGARTSFRVGLPTVADGVYDIQVTGSYQRLRTSSAQVWREVATTAQIKLRMPNIIAIDGGYEHGLGLSADRSTIFAWGLGAFGQLGNGGTSSIGTPTPVLDRTQLNGEFIAQLDAGGYHSLALTDDGTVWSWGYNNEGQLGTGDTTNRLHPVRVNTAGTPMAGKRIVQIAAGHLHSLAVDEDGVVYAWGRGAEGQLGNGSTAARMLPTRINMTGALAGKRVKSVTGSAHSVSVLALTEDGLLYGWGSNFYGHLGNGSRAYVVENPVAVTRAGTPLATRQVKQVVAASGVAYVLTTDNMLLMMGQNEHGEAATGTADIVFRTVPTQIVTAGTPLGSRQIDQIAADGFHVLALTSDGDVYAWGWNHMGQAGIGALGPHTATCRTVGTGGAETQLCLPEIRRVLTAGTPMSGRTIRQIAAGDRWSYAVATDGTAYAWGDNGTGQLAVGSSAPYESSPRRMLFSPQVMIY